MSVTESASLELGYSFDWRVNWNENGRVIVADDDQLFTYVSSMSSIDLHNKHPIPPKTNHGDYKHMDINNYMYFQGIMHSPTYVYNPNYKLINTITNQGRLVACLGDSLAYAVSTKQAKWRVTITRLDGTDIMQLSLEYNYQCFSVCKSTSGYAVTETLEQVLDLFSAVGKHYFKINN